MTYKFKCDCGTTAIVEIPISEYDREKNNQFCPKCGSKMSRKIEFEGSIGRIGAYDSISGTANWQR